MMNPPFETARAQSELFTFQCSQWEPIQNSQIIGRYKEMSVWHQVHLTIYPPIWNCQSSEWTLCFSMWSMRANLKQSSNRKIEGNVSVTPQLIWRYNEMSVWHQVHLMIYPPFKTARAQSELFTFQCSQWEQIRNSQVIGRYQEMSVWHLN